MEVHRRSLPLVVVGGGGGILGTFESMKRSLNRVIFRSSVNYEELLTVVIEIEGIKNSRPLTYRYRGNPNPGTFADGKTNS